MKLSRDALRGYLLEEVLAYLIRNTGYRLLVDERQDPQELGWKHNGLVVKGRGAVHQVDVLGELSWIPAFTYPLRLFVEAKFRGTKTGIPVVRNMVATLLDVNQNNLPQVARQAGVNPQLRPKYYYAGAIFSASGFSGPAMDMALAHNVSLIELNSPAFAPLLDAVTTTADSIINWLRAEPEEDDVDADNEAEDQAPLSGSPSSRGKFLFSLRTALRSQFETQTTEPRDGFRDLANDIVPLLGLTTRVAQLLGQLFVGMGQGPFMLVLQADDPEAFLRFAMERPSHDVSIKWDRHVDDGGTWAIVPTEPSAVTGSYRLTFRVPKPIRDWVFSSENVFRAAWDAKQQFFSNITIYHTDGGQDHLIRLKFNAMEIQRRGD